MTNRNDESLEGAKVRVERAYKLLKYAIYNNLSVDDGVVKTINTLKYDFEQNAKWTVDMSIALDTSIRDLTKLTYPTTMYTLKYTLETKFGKYAQLGYLAITLLTVFIGGLTYYKMMTEVDTGLWPMGLAVCMGAIGAELNIYFIFLGLSKDLALAEGDIIKQFARIILGAIVGYLAYTLFSMESFASLALNKSLKGLSTENKIYFMMPFLMGYSVRLVFGILNKGIKSVELTLGLEDKADELALRNRQK
jgi:hypothetical protein